uniref:(northern house mosquito) hypothetical protein n=1 Tax=Culex pipiens TaxID=7175 RepID=A0A8D8CB74_CULPI
MKSAPVATVNSTYNRNRVCAGSRGTWKTSTSSNSSSMECVLCWIFRWVLVLVDRLRRVFFSSTMAAAAISGGGKPERSANQGSNNMSTLDQGEDQQQKPPKQELQQLPSNIPSLNDVGNQLQKDMRSSSSCGSQACCTRR